MGTSLWVIRIFFLFLCVLAGYAISQRPGSWIDSGTNGIMIGFGLGGLLIAIDEMLKGFSLRAFSAATFGLFLGSLVAWMIDRTQLFIFVEHSQEGQDIMWAIRLALFLGFGYIGMVLAMRSNKDDFSLIIPYVRFARRNESENFILLDTSVVIDGRIACLLENGFIEGVAVIPRFVLGELQKIADSSDPVKRARGRRGLEMLSRLQSSDSYTIKIHEGDPTEEIGVDSKLIVLAQALPAKLITNDYNLGKLAELQSVTYFNLNELAKALKPEILPGEIFKLKIVREGNQRDQGIGYMSDGTMVVVNQASGCVGEETDVRVLSPHQTGAGVIIFAEKV
jgi:uncharacterized protein YacL